MLFEEPRSRQGIIAIEGRPELGGAGAGPRRAARGPAMVREGGKEQGGEAFAPVVDLVAQAQRVAHGFMLERPERFANVAGGPWPAGASCSAGFQNLELKAGVEFREIVQEDDDGKAGLDDRAQSSAVGGAFESGAQDRIAEHGFEARSDVRAVVLETVEVSGGFEFSPGGHLAPFSGGDAGVADEAHGWTVTKTPQCSILSQLDTCWVVGDEIGQNRGSGAWFAAVADNPWISGNGSESPDPRCCLPTHAAHSMLCPVHANSDETAPEGLVLRVVRQSGCRLTSIPGGFPTRSTHRDISADRRQHPVSFISRPPRRR